MLTIICGEDIVASRQYVQKLKNEYRLSSIDYRDITPSNIEEEMVKGEQTSGLFSNKIVYFTQSLNTFISRGGRTVPEFFTTLSKDKNIELIDWEEKGSRELLKVAKLGVVKEFKPSKNIFQFLDLVVPGKRKEFINSIHELRTTNDELFIFTMLTRHLRALLLAKQNEFGPRVQPWQKGKLSAQAKAWDDKKLEEFYEGMHRIDVALKTSASPYSVAESLDILAVYYL